MDGGHGRSSERVWCRLDLTLPRALEEEALGRLGVGAIGAELRPIDSERSMVCIVFPTVEAATEVRVAAEEWLSEGPDPVPVTARLEAIPDERWVERYQAGLRPFPIGRRFEVFPAGRIESPDPTRIPLILVPGRAFGTGEHPTTRLCVDLLERQLRVGTRWLDLGCGNAVLSLVAAHLGASEVLALDNDPEAVEVALEVIAVNDAPEGVRVAVGSVDAAGPVAYDGIVANIQAPFFMKHAAELASRLAADGQLIVSGLLVEDRGELARAFSMVGMRVTVEERDGAWAALLLVRVGDAGS